MLRLSHFSLRIGARTLLHDIDFSIEPGQIKALVGESGSGKSLTALSCLGLQPESATTSGLIEWEGTDLRHADATRWQQLRGGEIGFVFQEPMTALNPLHSIDRQLREMLRMHPERNPTLTTRATEDARIEQLCDQVGLGGLKHRLNALPHQLSGGERQRVMIAMAIANRPKLLIADEPTTAVDVTLQAKILELLKKLHAQENLAILLITHDLPLVKRFAQSVAVMYRGQIVEEGFTKNIFANPQHDYTKKLLASAPSGVAAPVAQNAPNVLEVEHLRVRFAQRGGVFLSTKSWAEVLHPTDLTIRQGETLGVVGESGSGKTTLALALLRLIPSDGTIIFMGNSLQKMEENALRRLRQSMQLVFQDPFSSLNPRMTIGQIVQEGLLAHFPKLSAQERTERVEHVLEQVGLETDMQHRYAHEFSGGQRQRIAIARAFVLEPKFLVLDEPTSALDLTVQSHIIALLRNLQEKTGISYLFISHDLRVMRAIAHRICVLREGRIIEQGHSEDLFTNAQEPYTQSLIQAAFAE